MTTLAANAVRTFELDNLNSLPVVASDIIYQGAAVGDNGSGYARPLVAGDPFRGFAEAKVDNIGNIPGEGDGTAGSIRVNLRQAGRAVINVGGVTGVGDVGDPVYASDDDTFTKTSTSNSFIGRIVRFVGGTTVVVEFDANRVSLETLS